MNPALSIILPTFNCGRFLDQSVQSILDQDFQDFEFIIINDGSTDNTKDRLAHFSRTDRRVYVEHQANKGFAASLNRALSLARGEFVARMDADDIALPGRLSRQMRALQERPNLAVVGGYISIINEQGAFVRLKKYPVQHVAVDHYILKASPVAHPAVMYRAQAVRAVGGYRNAFFPADDYDLWLRLRDAGHQIGNIAQPVIAYRQHAASVSAVYRRQQAIASAVAQTASQARRLNLPDPTEGIESVSMATFERFPACLRPSKARQFEIEHTCISRDSLQDIQAALDEFERLPKGQGDYSSAARFLARASLGFRRNGAHARSFATLLRSLLSSPLALAKMPRF